MAIFFQTATPGGVLCGYHRVVKAEADFETKNLTAIVQSWPGREAFLLNAVPEHWSFELSFESFPGVEDALAAAPSCCLYGGQVVVDGSATMDAARATRRAELKRQREVLDTAPMIVDGIAVDADTTARLDILGALMEMQSKGKTEKAWRCADNVMRVLTLDQIMRAGVAVVARRQWLIDQTNLLEQALATAVDVDAVSAVAWPPLPSEVQEAAPATSMPLEPVALGG